MEVRLRPETESLLNELASQSGRPKDEFFEEAMAAYLPELMEVRAMLDSRYDDFKSGKVTPIDGQEFFRTLHEQAEESVKRSRNE
jgi:predicted DNA-binding protein